MTQRVLLLGATGGVGSACCALMSADPAYHVTEWSSQDLDLNYPERIFGHDISDYDILLNCTGHNQGTYRGFLDNSYENQLSQIMVNYVSNVMLLKHYARSRTHGKYVWCSTVLTEGVTPFKGLYLSTKLASAFAIDLIRQEATHISVLEAQFGAVRSGMRYRNFEGTRTPQEIEDTYNGSMVLSPDAVAQQLIMALQQDLEKVLIQ